MYLSIKQKLNIITIMKDFYNKIIFRKNAIKLGKNSITIEQVCSQVVIFEFFTQIVVSYYERDLFLYYPHDDLFFMNELNNVILVRKNTNFKYVKLHDDFLESNKEIDVTNKIIYSVDFIMKTPYFLSLMKLL